MKTEEELSDLLRQKFRLLVEKFIPEISEEEIEIEVKQLMKNISSVIEEMKKRKSKPGYRPS